MLKLFVWHDVLTDYSPGVMFALAVDVNEARRLIREKCERLPDGHSLRELYHLDEGLAREPTYVADAPVGDFVTGGA